jgi:hypothetical protein
MMEYIYIYIYTHKFQILQKIPFFGFRVPTNVGAGSYLQEKVQLWRRKENSYFYFKKNGICV